MAQLTATTFSTDPALWIFTSLTAGSSHIVTATSRLETILRANRVPFKAIDIATDEKARMLWGRRAGKDASGRVRKLPGLVQEGLVLGDITEIEEWNEYGELKQHVKIYYDEFTIPDINNKPKEPIKKKIIKKVPKGTLSGNASASASAPAPPPAPPLPKDESSTAATAKDKSVETPRTSTDSSSTISHRSIADEAAKKAKELRLQSLRDKVYGKKEEKAAEGKKPETDASSVTTTESEKKMEAITDASKTPETPRKPSVASTSSGSSVQSAKPAGLQSPTTGSWGAAATTMNPDALRETLQSPTTARWKPSDVGKPVTVHMGAAVASASQEEIAAVEKAEAIKEEPDKENSDEDVSQKKIAEVEKTQAIKEEPEKEGVEDSTKAAVPQKETAPKETPATETTEITTKTPQPENDDDDDDDDDDSDDSDDDDDVSEPETNPDEAKAKLGSEEKEEAKAKPAESKSGESNKSEGEAKPEGEPEK
ncbi:protein disulfide oxidoreductase domain protein [Colletotrichum incanum]|uniref:Protein disulfide oxidoreductase domain protein n=1 Tax=Colletotrichum incanum TaxID=1573173 RepID=A0A167B8S5_COLIC|nr:protein disulfide oxidoreductase domain protein [Colletotrichum incanum]OHW95639.1 neurofilament protein h form h2 protein [Colletotrichum incanum]